MIRKTIGIIYRNITKKQKINRFLRYFYNIKLRKRLINKDITLISSNCNGAVMLHDLNLQYNSPFVNLWVKPKDFIKLCEDLEHYMGIEKFVFVEEEGIDYPIGLLDDIYIYFLHYSSKEEAENAWNRRKNRIKYDNIFILFSDRDGCDIEDLKRFDELKYERKKVFVNRRYPEIKSAVYISGFENSENVGILTEFKSKYTFRRYLDTFDFVGWFNGTE